MRIAIDSTNLTRVGAGITHYAIPLLRNLIQKKKEWKFILCTTDPTSPVIQNLLKFPNVKYIYIPYLKLPEKIIKPIYSLVFFPLRLLFLRFDLFYSPYYDVLIPFWKRYIVTVHDTCYWEQKQLYPRIIILFHRLLFFIHTQFAYKIFTVSNTSKKNILRLSKKKDLSVSIIPNILTGDIVKGKEEKADLIDYNYLIHLNPKNKKKLWGRFNLFFKKNIEKIHSNELNVNRLKFENIQILKKELESRIHHTEKKPYKSNVKIFFYFGGVEYRKSIESIFFSFHEALKNQNRKEKIFLFLTGEKEEYENHLKKLHIHLLDFENFNFFFTGHLDHDILKILIYLSDYSLYPSLCEGFGRPVGESILLGTPVIARESDLIREIFPKGIIQFTDEKDFIQKISYIISGNRKKWNIGNRTLLQKTVITEDMRNNYENIFQLNSIASRFVKEIENSVIK